VVDACGNEEELVAPEPSDLGVVWKGTLDTRGEDAEKFVAGGVAESVVHLLQPVDVDEEDSAVRSIWANDPDLRFEPLHDLRALQHSGETVTLGDSPKLTFERDRVIGETPGRDDAIARSVRGQALGG
jgi:hypothetical protein